MKTVVCVKVTDGELSPFDQSAVECALRLSDDVTAVTMGRTSVSDAMLRLTRIGCKAVLLTDSAFAGADTLATAYALSKFVQRLSPDLVICGRQSIDGDTAQTGPALATMLGYSLSANVMQITARDGGLDTVTRLGDVSVDFPALITVERIHELRFPKLRSKTGEVDILNAADIGVDPSRCGLSGSPTRVMRTFESSVGRRKCKFIGINELDEVISACRSSDRKKVTVSQSERLLPLVWCVGDEVTEQAKTVAEKVKVIEKSDAAAIARQISEGRPDFVLWQADTWGRYTAPQVQAMLSTGLCADCTALETDGSDLFMYRPAFGGTLTAKIRCLTKPVMATVRTSSDDETDVIIGCGKGARDMLGKINGYAQKIGAQLGASRGLVDSGAAPYSQQIGLTGRSVGCAVYIAVGISGAVHHTCALDRVGTVIAVNKDRDARIFEYADYGIVADAQEVFG